MTFEFSPSTDAFATPSYTDASAYVQHVTTTRGRDGALSQFAAGQMNVKANNTGRVWDRRYSSGPFYNSGTGLDPRKRFRWRFRWNSVDYYVFTGFLDGIATSREPANRVGWANIRVTDGFKMISRANLPSDGSTVGVGDTVAARMGRIADYVGWPAGDRDFDSDAPALIGMVLNGQKALSEVYLASDGDLGQTYIAQDGKWTYRGHRWRLQNSLTSQGTMGEDSAGGELAYSDLVVDDGSDELIWNRCQIQAFDGTTPGSFDIVDSTSKTKYGESANNIGQTGLANLNVAKNTAEWVVAQYAYPIYRVKSLKIMPLVKPSTLIPFVLGLEIGERITVKSRPMNVGSVDTQDVYVEGIAHDFDISGDWTVTLQLSQASAHYWQIGVDKLGSSGTAVWA